MHDSDLVFIGIGLQVLLELLQVGSVVQFNEERLLALAEKAKLWVTDPRQEPKQRIFTIKE